MLLKEKAKEIIINKSKSGSTYKTFVFDCIDCENEIKAQTNQLKNHSGKCRKCTQRKRPYEHILNELIHTCNKTNKNEINLTYEEFIDIIKDSTCHYCNKELIYNKYTRDENSKYVSRAYQLDRKNNNLGYIKENLVPCCWECNRLKSNIYTYEDFLEIGKVLKEINKRRV